MADQLLKNKRAEQEADRIGAQFANSTDVMGDMGRTFNFDFSGVRMHGGAEGERMAASHGDLAYAQGNNAYFGADILNQHTPEANMAVGHELTHVMQQNDGAGVSEHVPFGESQGLGFFSKIGNWFKSLFTRKKKTKTAGSQRASSASSESARESATMEENGQAAENISKLAASVRYKSMGEEDKISYLFSGGRDRTSAPQLFRKINAEMFGLASKCDDLTSVDVDSVKIVLDNFVNEVNSLNSLNQGLNAPLSFVITKFNGAVDSILPDFAEYMNHVVATGGDEEIAKKNHGILSSMIERFKAQMQERISGIFED